MLGVYKEPPHSIGAKTNPQNLLIFSDCEGFGAANYSVSMNSRANFIKEMEEDAPDQVRQDPTTLVEWTMNAFNTAMRFTKCNLN